MTTSVGPDSPGHVLLVGFMGCGTSTVGRLLAEELSRPFIDLDDEISADAERPIPQIFTEEGEAGFRDREAQALARLSARAPAVVACGGGVVLRVENRRMLRELGTVVYLVVGIDEAMRRCGAGEERPLLSGRSESEVADILHQREPLYRDVADVTVDTDGLQPAEITERIREALELLARETYTETRTRPEENE